MNILFADTETYNDISITCGTGKYSATAQVMLYPYALNKGEVEVWDRFSNPEPPKHFQEAFGVADAYVFHNFMFDGNVLRHNLPEFCPPVEKVVDTMVRAYACSLPGALGDLCEILGVPVDKAKDKEGKKLIHLFCKPLPVGRKYPRATPETHPQEWEAFKEYARLDVEAMREVYYRLPKFNATESEKILWELDQKINRRGVQVDVLFAKKALEAIEVAKKGLTERTQDLTNFELDSATRRDALIKHLLENHGFEIADLQKSTIEAVLKDPSLSSGLRELLEIRLQACTTSTSKYTALVNGANDDGRLRCLLQLNGASRTGRWSGRTFQPQNLPRPNLKQSQIDAGIKFILAGCADLFTDNVMELTSNTVRSAIIAPKGKKLVVSDLSNIEGRVQAWLAGETWKLKAFSDFDNGTGHDLYKLAYAKSFNVRPEDVTKDQRQIGKVQELALAYEGGVGAFVTFATAYGINLDDLAQKAVIPAEAIKASENLLQFFKDKKRSTLGLSDETWVACDALKRLWREAHPNISELWPALKSAAADCITMPGHVVRLGKLTLERKANWLLIRLPSGRSLCYPNPRCEGEGYDEKVSYMGMNQFNRKWQRLSTYGGKFFENCSQAVARDVMAANMPLIEAAGYEIVLTVHDEVICEAPDSPEFNAKHLSSLLAAAPSWALDMPLAAGGFEDYRYRKD